jgi:hypothetical protein
MSQNPPQWPAYPQSPHGIPGDETALFNYRTLFPHHFIYGFPLNSSHVLRDVNSGLRQPGDQADNSKLPIPRATYASISANRVRARHACNSCRKQKAKCTGHEPCQRCEDIGVRCVYGIRKREEFNRYAMLCQSFPSGR